MFITFGWAIPILQSGYYRRLDPPDLWGLPENDQAEPCWTGYVKTRYSRDTHLFWTVIHYFSPLLTLSFILTMINASLSLSTPLVIKAILRYLELPMSERALVPPRVLV